MFISNFIILLSTSSQLFMEPFHFLFIKIDIPLLALSYFFIPLKIVYVIAQCFTSCSLLLFLLKLLDQFSLYFSYYFLHFISAALNIPCTKFQSPVSWLKSYTSVWFPRLCAWFFCISCFLVTGEELGRCINPQPGGPGDFWSRFCSSSRW